MGRDASRRCGLLKKNLLLLSKSLQNAEDTARVLALEERILCGPSTGAILHVALKTAKQMTDGVLVAMAPDGGEKYLSTQLCDEDKCRDCVLKYKIRCAYSPDVALPGIA